MRVSLVLCLSAVVLCASANDTTTIGEESATTLTSSSSTPTKATTTSEAPKPEPTTVLPPPPTPKPNPGLSKPETYDLTEENVTCLVATFAAQFVIEYTNTAKDTEHTYLNVVNATLDPAYKCVNGSELTLGLIFGEDKNKVALHFVDKDNEKYVDRITLEYTPSSDNFPGHVDPKTPITLTFENLTLFEVKGDKSYLCKKNVDVTEKNQKVTFGSAHIDSFRTEKNKDKTPVFRDAVECATDNDVNDAVPIAVGIALLALVVIVLIAYFIGRRRSRRLAYQSV